MSGKFVDLGGKVGVPKGGHGFVVGDFCVKGKNVAGFIGVSSSGFVVGIAGVFFCGICA